MVTTKDRVEFDPENHTYTINDDRYDHVTKVCDTVLQTKSRWWKDEHRLRGTFVHAISAAVDSDDWSPELTTFPSAWDEKQKDGVIKRGLAYEKFVKETGFRAAYSEVVVYSKHLRLAGRLDKFGTMWRGQFAGKKVLVELKSGEPTAAAKIQVAFYEVLFEEMYTFKPDLRLILHLRDDGEPRPEYRSGAGDITDAMCVLGTYRFMQHNNLIGD